MSTHRGWFTRHIPHFDSPNVYQGITLRLHDSLPQKVIKSLISEIDEKSVSRSVRQRREELLNAGNGSCYLQNPEIAGLVQGALQYFHQQRYELIAWVIMPNHLHTLILPYQDHSLSTIIHSWKSYTAHEANKILVRKGKFWADNYFDRYIRNDKHYMATINYIHNNPVKAGLSTKPEDWPFSSAREWWIQQQDHHPV